MNLCVKAEHAMIFATQKARYSSWFSPQRFYELLGLLAIVCVFGLMGCSNKPEPAASKPLVNACTLVTQAEMEAIFGRPMKTPEEETHETGSTCNYVSAEATETMDDVRNMISSTLLASPLGKRSAAEAYTQYVEEVKIELNIEVQEVAGVGDNAGWSDDVKQLTLFKGKMMLSISGMPAKIATVETCRKIAEKALTRWPK